MTQREELLLNFLLNLDEEELASSQQFGLCNIVPLGCLDELESLIAAWPEHSGRNGFPVRHPDLSPMDGYLKSRPEEMWSREHPYGAARWRLVEFCIEELSE